MSDEVQLCARYLYGKLNTATVTNALGTATRIFDTDVPQPPINGQDVRFPCVLYQLQGSEDSWGVGAIRIFVRPLFLVKVIVDNQSYEQASTIFKVVDTALQNTSGTVTAGSIYACYRESQQIRYSEVKPAGGYFRHLGGVYRLECRATITP